MTPKSRKFQLEPLEAELHHAEHPEIQEYKEGTGTSKNPQIEEAKSDRITHSGSQIEMSMPPRNEKLSNCKRANDKIMQ